MEENVPAAPKPLSVTELSLALKTTVERAFSRVYVQGELSQIKIHTSGHVYLSMKDSESVLSAVIWRGQASKLRPFLTEGAEVVASGKLTTYPARSNYQLVIEHLEPVGEGALLKLFEALKAKLKEEGLFDRPKRKIPFLPKKIGVITSETGAVIRDILHRVAERYPVPVVVWPVAVQGEGAADQIAAAIAGFNAMAEADRPDVLIVARGGGSLEDLWAFNEERVVRAAFASLIPLISAVGHETDTTLIDFVSDLRAPTPTGAAEYAVPVRMELLQRLSQSRGLLLSRMQSFLEERRLKLASLSKGLPDLKTVIEFYTQRLDDRAERFTNAFSNFIVLRRRKLSELSRLLETTSYKKILEKGFVLVKNKRGQAVVSAAEAAKEKTLSLQFKDGETTVTPTAQGSLF